MGLSDFFKKIIQAARENEPVKPEHIIYKNIRNPEKRRLISDEEFDNEQFQKETVAFALWKYNDNKNDYLAVQKCLTDMEDIVLTEKQVNKIVERLKLWNDIKSRQDRFRDLVSKAQTLVSAGQTANAFELVYNAYVEDGSDIQLVELITQIADMYNSEQTVLEIFDKLTTINPH